jgi:hypothetical protein
MIAAEPRTDSKFNATMFHTPYVSAPHKKRHSKGPLGKNVAALLEVAKANDSSVSPGGLKEAGRNP